jgi:hypothetical protein
MFLIICSYSLQFTECFINFNINNYLKQQQNVIIPSFYDFHNYDKYGCYHNIINDRLYAKKIAPNQGESMDQYRKVYI